MPVYSFKCTKCEHEYVETRKIAVRNEPSECPKCGSDGERTIDAPAGIQVFGASAKNNYSSHKDNPKMTQWLKGKK